MQRQSFVGQRRWQGVDHIVHGLVINQRRDLGGLRTGTCKVSIARPTGAGTRLEAEESHAVPVVVHECRALLHLSLQRRLAIASHEDAAGGADRTSEARQVSRKKASGSCIKAQARVCADCVSLSRATLLPRSHGLAVCACGSQD